MKIHTVGLIRYFGLMVLISALGWLGWQQHQMQIELELYQLHLGQLANQVAQANQPNLSRDEIKHYQQLAYLILNEPSDLELGEAYLNILITEYLEQKAMAQVQQTQLLIKEIQVLKQQVAKHVSLISTLQMDLLTPAHQESTWTPEWLKPWRDWIKLEVSQNPSSDIDPQRWRYWSTLELAKWYLVHGHYAEYYNTMHYLAKWTHVYPAGMNWDDALAQLLAPLQTLDLTVIKPGQSAIVSLRSVNDPAKQPMKVTKPPKNSEAEKVAMGPTKVKVNDEVMV